MDVIRKSLWLVRTSRFYLFATLAVVVISLISCSEDPAYSYPPTWKGFTYFPYRNKQYGPQWGQVFQGDSLVVRAVQNQHGSNLAGTSYRWYLEVDTFSTANPTKHALGTFQADHWYPTDQMAYSTPEGMTDPEGYFHLPENIVFNSGLAYITIRFDVSYNSYAQGISLKDATSHVSPYIGSINNTYGEVFMGSAGFCQIAVNKK